MRSNLGSFLALFSYPLVLEPYFKLSTQTWVWSGLYVAFVVLCGWMAWQMRGVTAAEVTAEAADVGPSVLDIAMWLALSACGSVLLLGTTSQITQEIAVFPFLWIAPLSIYLLTFILTFESDRWYRRGVFAVLAGVLAPVTCAVISLSVATSVGKQLAVYLGALVCDLHGVPGRAGAVTAIAPAPYCVLFDDRRGRSVRRGLRRCDCAAGIQRIQRVSDRVGERLHLGLSCAGCAAERWRSGPDATLPCGFR